MYWNERDHPVATSMRTMQAAAPQYQRTETCWPAASIPGPFSSSGNGLSSAAAKSWRTGSARRNEPLSASTRWRSMKIVDENYCPSSWVSLSSVACCACSSATAQPEISTSPLNRGQAFFRR